MSDSKRSRRVRALARELSEATGTHIEASYQGPGPGPWGGWLLTWSAGPTVAQVRTLVADLAATDEADLAQVRFDRSTGTEIQTAAAVLAWLCAHPSEGARLPYLDDDELPGHPDQASPQIRYRAASLVSAGWRHRCASPAADELARRARRSPDEVGTWLDQLGHDQDAEVIAFPAPPRRHPN